MGAQWIHGEQDNVVNELAIAHKLACDPAAHFSSIIFARSTGKLVEPKLASIMHQVQQKMLEPIKSGTKSFKNCGEFFVDL